MDEVRWQRAPVLWRQAMGEVVVLAPDGDEPLVLTPPGADVWALLVTPVTLAEMVATLSEAYDADAEVVAADLAPVLQRLAAAGAITAC